jgi:hypothetical protein
VATSIIISCPQCHKQSKAPAEVLGKKIKCKACGHIFAAGEPTGKASPPKAGKKGKKDEPERLEVKSFAQQMIEEEFKDDSNPYDVTNTDLRPRCPHCAMAMEEGDVICLGCGYNTQTRIHGVTVRVMGATIFERILWLLPGIGCVLAVFGLIALIFYLWIGLLNDARANQDSWLFWFFGNFPTQVYGTVLCLFAIWFAGYFAVRRLIFHPHPPEKIKR